MSGFAETVIYSGIEIARWAKLQPELNVQMQEALRTLLYENANVGVSFIKMMGKETGGRKSAVKSDFHTVKAISEARRERLDKDSTANRFPRKKYRCHKSIYE
jgi:hypothetical protein